MQTKIRLLLQEQSDLGLHCLPFNLLLIDRYCNVESNYSIVRIITVIILGVPVFRSFTVLRL